MYMSLSADVFSLVLYFVQQLGVVLGVGAQTMILVAYLLVTRDGTIEQKEERFGRVVVQLLKLGLYLIIVSGAIITFQHLAAGQVEIISTPAFIFKWLLIGVIGTITFMIGRKPFTHFFLEGFLGAHWYAMFILHISAPLTTWPDILMLYVFWTIGFMLVWNALVYMMRMPKKPLVITSAPATPAKIAEKPLAPPTISKPTPPPHKPISLPSTTAEHVPPQPKIVTPPKTEALPPLPVAPPKTSVALSTPPVSQPQAPIPQKPPLQVPLKPEQQPEQYSGLAAFHVMPTSAQEVDRQRHAASVQSNQ